MNFGAKSIYCLAMLTMLGSPSLAPCVAQEPTVQETLRMLDGSLQSIKSFDVWISATTQRFILTEGKSNVSPGHKEFVISNRRVLKADEKPQISYTFFHQLYQNGRGRIEFANGRGDNPSGCAAAYSAALRARLGQPVPISGGTPGSPRSG